MEDMNKQLQMFGLQDPAEIQALENRRRARSSDPVSSHEGATHIEGKLGALKMIVLGEATYIPHTARELAERCVTSHQGEVESYRKRCKELADAGYLTVGAFRHCSVTGKLARTYTRPY